MAVIVGKFPLDITDEQIVPLPVEAKILCVQVQNGRPCLWALIDTENAIQPRSIFTVGTGHDAEHVSTEWYIGTYQLHGGDLIFHVFGGGIV